MSEPGKQPDFRNLTENLSQQQAKISALKELVRQSESQHGKNTASAQEKVKNIAQRLSNLKLKTKARHQSSSDLSEEHAIPDIEEEKPQMLEDTYEAHSSSQRARSETPGSEKITLLRKQMELNRAKIAERESKSREIEQMVTQLKSKFETSQLSLEKSVELGRSMGDLSTISMAPLHSQSFSDVSHTTRGFSLENERNKYLEKRIQELEEKLRDKKNLTESEKVQKLERKILDLEENLREKESVIEARTKAVTLLSENLTKKKKDVVDSLEDTKQEMFKMQETFLEAELSYKDELNRLNRIINEGQNKSQNLTEKCEILEKSRYDLTIENSELKTKLEEVQDLVNASTKISELNKLNETLQKQISNIENQRYEFITEDEVGEVETRVDLLQKIKSLEELLETRNNEFDQLEEKLQEKTVELNVVNANFKVVQEKYNSMEPKSLFPSDTNADAEAQAEITKLKQQLDDSNKSMIKTKLKIKQLQKQVDSFKKTDTNKEFAKLTDEVQALTQRNAELEEQRSNLQHQESGFENVSELEKKIKVLETTCQNQTTAIQLLEEQKMDMTEDLDNAKSKLEEVTDQSQVKLLEEKVQQLSDEKAAVEEKLTRYVNENIELHERIEKLSKGSSAESIEMVNLTAQENEEYQKALVGHKDHLADDAGPEISQELNESLRSLREESSELMSKIELFTIERREVLDKLDAITIENQVLVSTIESIKEEKVALQHENESLKESLEHAEKVLSELQIEKDELSKNAAELNAHRSELQDEVNSLVKRSIDHEGTSVTLPVTSSLDRAAFEKLLKQLDAEVQNFNKNKDKHQKLKISKKLSDNAKNVVDMITNLLADFDRSLDDCKQLRNDLASTKSSAGDNKHDEELRKLQDKLSQRDEELRAIQDKLNNLQKVHQDDANNEIVKLQETIQSMNDELKDKDELSVKLQEMVDKISEERDRYEVEVQSQKTCVSYLRKEFDKLSVDIGVNNERLNEKSYELDKLQHEYDMRLKTSTNEVEILKTLVAEQKQLLIDSYQEHELDINQKLKEINDYQNQVKQMELELKALKELNDCNQKSLDSDLNTEIAHLKDLLNKCNQQLDDHKEELLYKQETIDTLNNQIIDLYKTMEENSNKIIAKDDELQHLQKVDETSRAKIKELQHELSQSNKTISALKDQLSARELEHKLLHQEKVESEDNKRVEELEKEVKALEVKNKEQLEKLKKFAASLKRKQLQCTELEEKLTRNADVNIINELKAQVIQYEEQLNIIKADNSKLNNSLQKSSTASNDEINELRLKVNHYEDIMHQNSQEMKALQEKLHESFNQLTETSEKLDAVTKERDELKVKFEENESEDKANEKKKMDKLKAVVMQLKHKLADKKKEVDDLKEELRKLPESLLQEKEMFNVQLQEMSSKILEEAKSAYEHDVGILRQQLDDLEAKNRLLEEDKQRKASFETQIETSEMIIVQLRDRIAKYEAEIESFESEKIYLQQEKSALAAKLEEKDALINQKLRETEYENFQLTETVKELTSEKNSILQKLSIVDAQFTSSTETLTQDIESLENVNSRLLQQVEQLQSELKKTNATYEQTLAAKHLEIDEMEADLSSQLQKIETEKKEIQEALEKANDRIRDLQDEVVRSKEARNEHEKDLTSLRHQHERSLKAETDQYCSRLMHMEKERENLRSQYERQEESKNSQILILKQQIADLESMRSQVGQNQTDDQVLLYNDNIRLKELLIEKENEIQHKTIQLQMVSTFDSPVHAVNDPFANLAAAPPTASSIRSGEILEENLRQAEEKIAELDSQANRVQDLLSENQKLREKIAEIESMMDNLVRNSVEKDTLLEVLESKLEEKNKLIEQLQGIVKKHEQIAVAPFSQGFATIDGNPAPIPNTSMLFDDNEQPSAASLFDDSFALQGQQQEVIEEFIQPKKAYICYEKTSQVETQTDNDWLKNHEEKDILIQQLQAHIQVLDQRLLEQFAEVERQTQNLNSYQQRIRELESSEQPQQSFTVTSQYFNPSSAQQSESSSALGQNQSMAALEIEDGWGWEASDGLETQQQSTQQSSLLSPRSDLEVRLQEQRDIVERLEQEKNSLNEELSNMRENSKKMVRKLKEYQMKVKEFEQKALKKSVSVESNDMDLVIQEEQKSQIQMLEARLKELYLEKEKEHHEKEALLKRVDVLTAANERLIEAKERQDNQAEMLQLKIRDLNQKLQNLEEWGEDSQKKDPQPTQSLPIEVNEVELQRQKLEIQDLKEQLRDLQVEYDESQALLHEEKSNNKILEERLATITSSHLQESSKDEEIEKLSRLLKECSANQDSLSLEIATKNEEIRVLISKIDLLSNESSNIKTILDDLSTQIQLKTNENQELNQRLQNLASNNDELSRERQIYNESIEQNFRQYSHELEQQLQTLHAELQYKDQQLQQLVNKVGELSLQLDQKQSLIDVASSKEQEANSLRALEDQQNQQIQASSTQSIPQRLLDLEKINKSLVQEKEQMEHELQVLNEQVLASLEFEDKMSNMVLDLDAKNIEIQMLKASLEKIQQTQSDGSSNEVKNELLVQIEKLQQEKIQYEQSMKSSIDLLNAQWSQAVEQRGNEIAKSWQHRLDIRESEFTELETSLRNQLSQKSEEASKKLDKVSGEVQETINSETVLKMRSIMESQEVEIVSLKEQLAIRSAEYASLSARVDPYHQMSTSMSISPVPQDNEKVPRSELDLALYMLHQRDMRLEEMTMELVRLLEERDQLQIRLSNSLRQVEEVRIKHNILPEVDLSAISKTTTPEKSPTTADSAAFQRDEQLRAKLSELNTVRHDRDKLIQDEREQRFQENIAMLQRDIVNIPPEAAARIVASSSDQGQSPSSVLMNWFLGKNPE